MGNNSTASSFEDLSHFETSINGRSGRSIVDDLTVLLADELVKTLSVEGLLLDTLSLAVDDLVFGAEEIRLGHLLVGAVFIASNLESLSLAGKAGVDDSFFGTDLGGRRGVGLLLELPGIANGYGVDGGLLGTLDLVADLLILETDLSLVGLVVRNASVLGLGGLLRLYNIGTGHSLSGNHNLDGLGDGNSLLDLHGLGGLKLLTEGFNLVIFAGNLLLEVALNLVDLLGSLGPGGGDSLLRLGLEGLLALVVGILELFDILLVVFLQLLHVLVMVTLLGT